MIFRILQMSGYSLRFVPVVGKALNGIIILRRISLKNQLLMLSVVLYWM